MLVCHPLPGGVKDQYLRLFYRKTDLSCLVKGLTSGRFCVNANLMTSTLCGCTEESDI